MALQGGDTVLFKGGVVYAETLTITAGGEPGNPIVYQGNSDGKWGTGKAIIDGGGKRQHGIRAAVVAKRAASHVVVDGFVIRNLRCIYDDTSGQDPRGIVWEGGGASDIEIRNCDLHDINKAADPIGREAGKVTETRDSLRDEGRDFRQAAGKPGTTATHELHLFWNNGDMTVVSDYNHAWGYVGEACGGDGHAVRLYRDLGLTQPGWRGQEEPGKVGYDRKPGGSVRTYALYEMARGNFNQYGGYGIVLWASESSVHHCQIRDAEFGVSAGGGGMDVHHNEFSAMTAALIGAPPRLKFRENLVHGAAQFGKGFGYHFSGLHLWRNQKDKPCEGFECFNNTFLWDFSGTAVIYLEYNILAPKIHHNVIVNVSDPVREPASYIDIAGKGYLKDDFSGAEVHHNLIVGRGGKGPFLARKAGGVKPHDNVLVNLRTPMGGERNTYVAYRGYGLADVKKRLAAGGEPGSVLREDETLEQFDLSRAAADLQAGAEIGEKRLAEVSPR